MRSIFHFPYFTSMLFTFLALLGIYAGHGYFGILLLLGIHPILDTWIGSKPINTVRVSPLFFDRFLILTVFVIYAVWFYCLYFYRHASSSGEAVLIAISCGLVMGFLGITTAHELVHRPEGHQKWAGFVILWVLNYGHWGVEHVFGHHKNVGTDLDPVTARKNETIYLYLVRAIGGSFIHSFQFEKQKSFLKSKVRLSLLIQFALNGIIFFIWGVDGLIFHWIQSLLAVILLESVEYVEHYGLARKKLSNGLFEPTNENHSWDCDFFLSNAALINLGYHSYHHQKPLVPYQELANRVGSRKMPLGYSAMILLAFLPPVFFSLMNPRIELG